MTSTLLAITGVGLPPYSARGITETLAPIAGAGQMRRTINGTLVDLGATQFRKYRLTLTCTDMDTPALDGVWPGLTIVVDCISELAYATSGGSASRPVVTGSTRTADGFTFYRPRLTMKVTNFTVGRNEYGASVNWTLEAEEV